MITAENVKDLFDYRDGKLFWKETVNSRAVKGNEAGTLNVHGYRQVGYKGKIYLTHRLIWLYHTGEWPEVCDHKRHEKLDNRIEKLRDVSGGVNNLNRSGPQKNSTTGVLGVRMKRGRYVAHYRSKDIGSFKTLEEATIARHSAELADPAHVRTAL